MKKSLRLILPIGLGLSSLIWVTSCSFISNDQRVNVIENNNEQLKLNFINYFEHQIGSNDQQRIKQQITEIMKKYRLYEWNNYYENNSLNNALTTSKVLNIAFRDYSPIHVDYTKVNEIFSHDEIVWTSIYKQQDEQFRYFNDFINIINEEQTPNHEDFLYLRWVYYSIDAAIKYKNIRVKNKPIYEVNLTDWMQAIVKLITSSGTDSSDLLEIVKGFFLYYGFSIKDNSPDLNLIEPSIIHLLLASKDLVMRFSSKPIRDMQQYQLWLIKAQRAKQMYALAQTKYNLLADSFSGDFNQDDVIGNIGSDMDVEAIMQQANGFLAQLKEKMMILIDQTISQLVTINVKDYCYLNQMQER